MAIIKILRITLRNTLHHARQSARILNGYQQMYMIVHQHISMYLTSIAHSVLTQPLPVDFKIFIDKKTRLPVVPALDDMQRNTGQR